MALSLLALDIAYWKSFYYCRNQAFGILGSIVHHLGDAAMIALCPPFLAAALQTRLTQPFGTKRIRRFVTATAIALFFGTIASSAISNSSAGQILLYMSVVVVFAFGLVASIQAWRSAAHGCFLRHQGFIIPD